MEIKFVEEYRKYTIMIKSESEDSKFHSLVMMTTVGTSHVGVAAVLILSEVSNIVFENGSEGWKLADEQNPEQEKLTTEILRFLKLNYPQKIEKRKKGIVVYRPHVPTYGVIENRGDWDNAIFLPDGEPMRIADVQEVLHQMQQK